MNRRWSKRTLIRPSPPPAALPEDETWAYRLADEVMRFVGDRFLREALKDRIVYLARTYSDRGLLSGLLLEIARREGQRARMDSFVMGALERQREALELPDGAWRYVYEAHRLESRGDDRAAADIRFWVLRWASGEEWDATLIPEARRRLEELCPSLKAV